MSNNVLDHATNGFECNIIGKASFSGIDDINSSQQDLYTLIQNSIITGNVIYNCGSNLTNVWSGDTVVAGNLTWTTGTIQYQANDPNGAYASFPTYSPSGPYAGKGANVANLAYGTGSAPPAPITTIVAGTSPGGPVGGTVTFTSTVTGQSAASAPPSGTVTGSLGMNTSSPGTLAGSGAISTATFSMTGLPSGTDTISLAYSGDVNYASSTGHALAVLTGTPPTPWTRVNFTGFETGDAQEVCGNNSTTLTQGSLLGSALVQGNVVEPTAGHYALQVNPGAAGVGGCYITAPDSAGLGFNLFNVGPIWVRFYFRVDTLPATGDEEICVLFNSTNTAHNFSVRINSGGMLTAYNATDTTLLATGATVLAKATWYRIELTIVPGASNAWEVKINGTHEIGGSAPTSAVPTSATSASVSSITATATRSFTTSTTWPSTASSIQALATSSRSYLMPTARPSNGPVTRRVAVRVTGMRSTVRLRSARSISRTA